MHENMDEMWVITSFAVESMLYEVTATPKPGLVDRVNNGAHRDMDYYTFMSSAAALHDTFDDMFAIGRQAKKTKAEPKRLLAALREAGMEAERRMFLRTGGINTHKGMIFSLGLLCGGAGYLTWDAEAETLSSEALCAFVSEMCRGICEKDFAGIRTKEHLTKGERMYLQYGCTGVRGVAESGYEVIRKVSLPVYRELRAAGTTVNDALVHTLLYLIRDTEDTNIISRHDKATAQNAQECAKKALRLGGMLSGKGRAYVQHMDEDFVERYISPGGCADLLAVTHFLWCVEERNLR